jgi:pseudaminic acid cytidylyltransferase
MKLCVIPARGGSKRIPRKNIKEFCGKPMIAYSIQAALASQSFDRVVVSTDDAEIAEVAKTFGAEAPFMRPQELANDFAGTIPVIKHAIEWFEQNGQAPSLVCCLYATAPFVQAKSIHQALDTLQTSEADYCFTATSFPFPIQRAIKIKENKRVEMFYPEHFSTRSQDLEEAYHDAGQFYWGKSNAWKEEVQIFSDKATAHVLPRHLVQDIDTPEDWKRAELMYQLLKQAGEFV